jgi:cytochrome c-type biogenesis protein CcmF
MLKIWNVSLIVLTFVLTIFGTFITRSGIISSVHSFAASNLGPVFLAFIFLILIASIWLIVSRREFLRSENRFDSLLSRETSFLFNNLLLLGIFFATFWGTIFPVVSEAVRGVKITVGPPFFNQVNIPIALALLVLTGICPLLAWRYTSIKNLKRNFLYPTVISLLALILFIILRIGKTYALIAFTFSIFVLVSILMELLKGTLARRKISGDNILKSFLGLIFSNRRRYGGYIIHIGIILIFVGVGGSAFKTSVETSLQQGESVSIKNYEIKFEKLTEYPTKNKQVVAATMSIFVNGKKIDVLTPEKNYYRKKDQPSTEVDIRSSLKEDLYIILVSHTKDGTAAFKILVNPLIKWLWIGGYLIMIGAVVAVWPRKKPSNRYPEKSTKVKTKR